jgi:hypothetical protein
MRALSVDAGDRYDTAADFAEALEIAALEADVRIATQREVAEFVRQHKPASKGAGSLPEGETSHSGLHGEAWLATGTSNVASIASSSSRSTGNGAARSLTPVGAKKINVRVVAMGVASFVVGGFAVAYGAGLFSGSGEPEVTQRGASSAPAFAASSGQPEPSAGVQPSASTEATAPEPDAGSEPDAASPEPVASPAASATTPPKSKQWPGPKTAPKSTKGGHEWGF